MKKKKDIKQSLDELIQGEMLEGDNSYHCEQCDKKVTALKRTCLKRIPNHLIMVLKRFEFNYDNMQKVKINQFCSFPDQIDFREYSQQGLWKAVRNKQLPVGCLSSHNCLLPPFQEEAAKKKESATTTTTTTSSGDTHVRRGRSGDVEEEEKSSE